MRKQCEEMNMEVSCLPARVRACSALPSYRLVEGTGWRRLSPLVSKRIAEKTKKKADRPPHCPCNHSLTHCTHTATPTAFDTHHSL